VFLVLESAKHLRKPHYAPKGPKTSKFYNLILVGIPSVDPPALATAPDTHATAFYLSDHSIIADQNLETIGKICIGGRENPYADRAKKMESRSVLSIRHQNSYDPPPPIKAKNRGARDTNSLLAKLQKADVMFIARACGERYREVGRRN
jgi:hypothetical protein